MGRSAGPEVWDERRWRRSARRWRIAALAVVAVGAVLVYRAFSDDGPRVPSRVYLSVAGPDVRILKTGSYEDATNREQPEELLVEVGGADDPVTVLTASLRSNGWQVSDHDAALPAPGGDSYVLSWQLASDVDAATDPGLVAAHADPADPRQLLITIENPISLYADDARASLSPWASSAR